MSSKPWVCIGKIVGVFGVNGWNKVFSYTAPKENIFEYNPWFLLTADRYSEYRLIDRAKHGKGLIAKLAGIDSRDDALRFKGIKIFVSRDQFEPLEKDEYYWFDLQGLEVVTESGQSLGVIDHLIETGANDVLVIKGERERLVPFVQQDVIKKVDMESGKIIVDWDPDF